MKVLALIMAGILLLSACSKPSETSTDRGSEGRSKRSNDKTVTLKLLDGTVYTLRGSSPNVWMNSTYVEVHQGDTKYYIPYTSIQIIQSQPTVGE